MTKIPPYIYIVLFFCGALIAFSFVPKSTPAARMLATASPLPSSTPTIMPTITVPMVTADYSAAWPVQTQAAAAVTMSAANQRLAAAAATLAGATSQAIENSFRIGTPTAIAIQTAHAIGTEQARATEQAGKQAVYYAGLQATIAARADAERRNANRTDILYLLVGMTISGSVLAVIWSAAYRMNLAAWQKAAAVTSPLLRHC